MRPRLRAAPAGLRRPGAAGPRPATPLHGTEALAGISVIDTILARKVPVESMMNKALHGMQAGRHRA